MAILTWLIEEVGLHTCHKHCTFSTCILVFGSGDKCVGATNHRLDYARKSAFQLSTANSAQGMDGALASTEA